MVIAIMTILGLIWGSFVNALVWRLHELGKLKKEEPQASSQIHKHTRKKPGTRPLDYGSLSIWRGRSMCPNCHHTLAVLDLIPLASWLALRGKCRYCHKSISAQYPLVEVILALVFILSYIYWPLALNSGASITNFGLWLVLVIIMLALAVYDYKWQLLPNKLVLALAVVAVAQVIVAIISSSDPVKTLINCAIAAAIGGGLFLILILINNKWIGGGDVKLGFVIGLIAATPAKSVLMIFLAALLGTLISLPLLASQKTGIKSKLPFGPFLIIATGIVVVFGQVIVSWYFNLFTLG